MRREGKIIVESVHPLFPADVCESIVERVGQLVELIEQRQRISIKPVAFIIQGQSAAGRPVDRVVRTVFAEEDYPNMRFILSSERISAGAAIPRFRKNDLFVNLVEGAVETYAVRRGQAGPQSSIIEVNGAHSRRSIEDLLLDIHLGGYFCQSSTLSEIIKREGLAGLYRRKARYARNHVANRGTGRIAKDATYAVLASLGGTEDDLQGRADSAFGEWVSFARSISVFEWPASTGDSRKLRRHQLSSRKVAQAALALPPGHYKLLQLTRSTIRKSKKTANGLRGIFGPRARPNSFRILGVDDFFEDFNFVSVFIRDGHIVAHDLARTDEDFVIN